MHTAEFYKYITFLKSASIPAFQDCNVYSLSLDYPRDFPAIRLEHTEFQK